MPASKIVNEQEIIQWIEEGHPYNWMVEQYARKYDIEVTPSLFANFRRRRGLDARLTRDDTLIPWHVLPKHRWLYPVQMLRAEARRRAGRDLKRDEAERLTAWKQYMEMNHVVVHYDPELEDGFVFVPREDSDADIVRMPAHPQRLRGDDL